MPENEEFVKVEKKQFETLISQLKELRDKSHNQKVALDKAMNIINFVQSLLPVDSSGQIDVDPMKLFSLIGDKKKFEPIMKDLRDLEIYRKEYEKTAVRVIN